MGGSGSSSSCRHLIGRLRMMHPGGGRSSGSGRRWRWPKGGRHGRMVVELRRHKSAGRAWRQHVHAAVGGGCGSRSGSSVMLLLLLHQMMVLVLVLLLLAEVMMLLLLLLHCRSAAGRHQAAHHVCLVEALQVKLRGRVGRMMAEMAQMHWWRLLVRWRLLGRRRRQHRLSLLLLLLVHLGLKALGRR